MSRLSTEGARSALAILLMIGAAGCIPLPIRHTELVTAEVTGIVREADGTPAAGIPVAVTPSQGDMACTRASASAITDSAGRFHLPAVHERKRILWFGLMENFGATSYRFCAGAPTATAQLAVAMTASTYIRVWFRGDSLDCVAWRLRESARVSCNGPINQHGMFSFGAWSDARDSGSYRVLLADEDDWGNAKRAVIQWITLPSANSSAGSAVRAELELPTGEAVVGATYAIRDGRPVARVESIRRTKWDHRRWLAFELGGPGEAREVPDH